jgi:hypothetical protein
MTERQKLAVAWFVLGFTLGGIVVSTVMKTLTSFGF